MQAQTYENDCSSMPVLIAFPCTGCQCAVQTGLIECIGSTDDTELHYTGQHSSQLTSNGCADVCRGQGTFYATRKPDQERPPPYSEHFNFLGIYCGMCCYCALKKGLNLDSFFSVGCYDCKRRRHLVMMATEFARLKKRRSGSAVEAWSTDRWAGLPDSLIDVIIAMAIDGRSR